MKHTLTVARILLKSVKRAVSLKSALSTLLLMPMAVLQAATYHVDSIAGDDTHSGETPAAAWRSLAKVNAFTFQPDDRLLLRAGSAWTGRWAS